LVVTTVTSSRQEGGGHRHDRAIEQAARVVAQVEHDALEVRSGL
jgi:hypothetical protein